jgi:hypothetical protein
MQELMEKNISEYLVFNLYGIFVSIAMMFYVSTKFIFNIFATIKLPLDKWSLIDIFCAFTNIICFQFLNYINSEDILDLNRKQIYSFL